MEQISKLEELLSSKKHILQVDIVEEYRVALGYWEMISDIIGYQSHQIIGYQ